MSKITLRKFIPENKELFLRWFENDTEGMKFLPSYSRPDDWLQLIDDKTRFMFIAYLDLTPCGFFDFEVNKERGHFSVYISPEFRGRHLAQEVLKKAFQLDMVNSVDLLDVGVEGDNRSSISLLKKFGFEESGKDEDGMLVYLKKKPFVMQ